MAIRYWVGGTGTWNSTNTANWSATSGGAGGASAPTPTDTPVFNSLSGTGTVTYTGTTNAGAITFSGDGITLSLGAALASSGTITITAGTFLTNGYNLSCTTLVSTSGTRTIDLGASTVTLTSLSTGLNFSNSSGGLTFNAGTSTINVSGSTVTFAGGGLTFNNVRFTSGVATTRTITGNNTFNGTLYIERYGTTGVGNFVLAGDQTIAILDTRNSTSVVNRVFMRSDILGTTRTLTITSLATTVVDYDFRDISIAGAVSPLSGTRLGDCSRNTGINFTSKTVYWSLAAGGSWTSTAWATSEGGTPSSDNFPLAQDTVIFPATGLNDGATVTLNFAYALGTVDMSARNLGTLDMTFTTAASTAVYGNWINGTGVKFSGTNILTFSADTPQTILTAGRSFTQSFTFVNPSSVTLLDNFFAGSSSRITLTAGTFDLNNFNLTAGTLSLTGTTSRTLATGTGVITLSGTTSYVVDMLSTTALTVTGDRNLVITGTSVSDSSVRSCLFGVPAIGEPFNVTITLGQFSFSITNVGHFDNLIFTNFTGSTNTNSINIRGDFQLSSGQTFSLVPTFIGNKIGRLFTTNGVVLSPSITFNGVEGSWILQDALTSSNITTTAIRVLAGSLDLNGKTVTTAGLFSSNGTLARAITFNGGLIVLTGSGSVFGVSGSNISLSAGSAVGTVRLTSASDKTFGGGSFVLPLILDQAGAGALTIVGSNTFEDIVNSYSTVGATTIIFPNSTTTVNNFTAIGSAGKLLTIYNAVANGSLGVIDLSGGGSITSIDYLSIKDLSFTPFTTTGDSPYVWYAGTNSTNLGNNKGIAFLDAATTKAYLITSGSSWTVPSDWNNSNNAIHLIGGGGGGGGVRTTGTRQSGGGGGGGGYTVVNNQSISGIIDYIIGAGGTGGTSSTASGNAGGSGETTSWNSGAVTAGGGSGAPGAIAGSSVGGAGGIGAFANGGAGGSGITGNDTAGGGGGGAGGPNGNGGAGGTGGGLPISGSGTVSGAGGGGNGGGTAGSDGSTRTTLSGGAGGNNFSGIGGGATRTTSGNGNIGTLGGGGGGSAGAYLFLGGAGGAGIDILNTAGGGGGAGSGGGSTQSLAGLYGGGGAGGGTNAGSASTAGQGAQGMIFIIYSTSSIPPVVGGSLGNFFMFF